LLYVEHEKLVRQSICIFHVQNLAPSHINPSFSPKNKGM